MLILAPIHTESQYNTSTLRVSPPKAVFGGTEGFIQVHVSNNGGINFCQADDNRTIHLNFSIYDHLKNSEQSVGGIHIESAAPLLGPLSGGTKKNLNGQGVSSLVGYLACHFGWTDPYNSVTVSAELSSNSDTFCVAPAFPPGLLSTLVEVAVFISGSSTPIYIFDFSYVTVPVAINVSPWLGPTTGGTLLSIQGGGFLSANTSVGKLICVFSRESVDAEGNIAVQSISLGTLNSPNEIQCESPPLTEGSTFLHISLSTDSDFIGIDKQQNLLIGHTREDALLYEFYTMPSVIDLDPLFGDKEGGYQIKVLGEGFLPSSSLSVRFGSPGGGVNVRGTYLSHSEILCVVPSLPPGFFVVSASNNDQDYSDYNNSFSSGYGTVMFESLSEEMMVDSSTPRFGPVSGNSTLVINGRNFLSGAITTRGDFFCQFGTEKVSAVFINDTAVSCISPPAPRGSPMDMSVSLIKEVGLNNILNVAGKNLYFSYIEPVVLAVQPLWGPIRSGTTVRVVGQGFPSGPHPSIQCSFGLAEFTPALWVSEEVLLCTSPPSPFDGTTTKREVEFSIHFSKTDDTSQHHITKYKDSEGRIQNLSAATASVNYSVLPSFAFVENCITVDIYPTSGPSLGGTQVIITGLFFPHAPKLSVRFGTQDVLAEWLNETTLLCISPGSTIHGDVEIFVHYGSSVANEVIMTCGWSDEKTVTFTYIEYGAEAVYDSNVTKSSLAISMPMVIGIFPSWGPSSGGTEVTVFGSGFTERDSLLCVFGNETSPANSTWVNSSTFRCVTPRITSMATITKNELLYVSWLPADSDASVQPVSIYPELDLVQFEFLDICQPTYEIWPKSEIAAGADPGLFIVGTGFPVDDIDMRPLSVVFDFGGGNDISTTTTVYMAAVLELEVAAFVHNSTMLECPFPSSPLTGTAAVYIAVGGVKICYVGKFMFHEGGYIDDSAISPAFSSVLGNGKVYVKGKGFQKGAECIFGVPPPENGTVVAMGEALLDGSGLMCHVPPVEQPGTVTLGVSGALGTALFTYVPAPTVLSVLPSSGPSVGGNTLRISGSGFLPIDTYLCIFSSSSSAFAASSLTTRVSSSLVLCDSIPPGVGGSTVSVDLKINGVELGINAPYFYQSVVTISKVSPSVGSIIGGTIVTLEGMGFVEDEDWWCWFGTIKVPARIHRVSGNESSDVNEHSTLQCMLPPLSQRSQSVSIAVSTDGSLPLGLQQPIHPSSDAGDAKKEDNNIHYFTYIAMEEAEPAWPTSGTINGGTDVTVQLISSNAVINLETSVMEEFECAFKVIRGMFEVTSPAISDLEKNTFTCTVPPFSSFNLTHNYLPFTPMAMTFNLQSRISKVVIVQHLSFTYTLDLRVASVSIGEPAMANGSVDTVDDSPNSIQVVIVTGSGFLNGPHLCCKISGILAKEELVTIVAANWISELEIHCNIDTSTFELHSSPSKSFLVTSVGISNNGEDFTTVQCTQAGDGAILPPVLSVVNPVIFGIDIALVEQPEPHIVYVAWGTPGGENVILFGDHFFPLNAPIACVYQFTEGGGSFPVSAIVQDDSHVLCRVPIDTPSGTAELQLCSGGGAGSSCLSGNATVIIPPLPTVNAVYPHVGRAVGSDIIRFEGKNLCQLPQILAGQLDYEELALNRVAPMCRFGDSSNMVNALLVAEDCTWVECLSPPLHSASSPSRSVEVSVSLGTSTYYIPTSIYFTYVDQPLLRATWPRFSVASALESAQDAFSIIGGGFEAGMQCIFEFGLVEIGVSQPIKASTLATVISSTKAFCPAPIQALPGMADMWLLSSAGEQSEESLSVFFLQESEISDQLTLHPKFGPMIGGNIIGIQVTDSLFYLDNSLEPSVGWSTRKFFSAAHSSPASIECRFGHMRVPAILVSEWVIQCTVPSSAVSEVVTVCVALTSSQVCNCTT